MRTAIHFIVCFALLSPFAAQCLGQSAPLAPSPSSSNPPATPAPFPAASGQPLTREDAERLALANNPQVSISHLLALAQHQVVRESRSAELPTLTGSLTAQDANQASR